MATRDTDGNAVPATNEYRVCDIHGFAFVMGMIGRGIVISDNTGGWTE